MFIDNKKKQRLLEIENEKLKAENIALRQQVGERPHVDEVDEEVEQPTQPTLEEKVEALEIMELERIMGDM